MLNGSLRKAARLNGGNRQWIETLMTSRPLIEKSASTALTGTLCYFDGYVDRERSQPTLALLLFALIVLRQGLAWPQVFSGEFILEDFALLLILTFAVVPPRFKRPVFRAIYCPINSVIALMAWSARGRLPVWGTVGWTACFTLLAVYSAGLSVTELLRLKTHR
jgi:hypothetical protein